MLYDALKHVIVDQTRTAMLKKTLNKPVDQYFKASKTADALCMRVLCNGFFAPIASFIETQTMDTITDQGRVDVVRSTSKATSIMKDLFVAAEASVARQAQAR